jgi:formylglycine-generating enzyme required for sulfatase activity
MGSDEDWSSPEMSIAALAYTDRTDWFTYSGTGLTPGYSGSPVVDLNGLLVGVHQGETDGGRRLGWAQRITEVDETLVRVLGVTPDFGGLPSIPSAPPPAVPTAPATGTVREWKDGLKYVWIDSGKFIMGCSPGDGECFDEEKPAHQVTITKGFWMGQTPVTQEAYRKVTGKSPSHFQGASLPVEQVSWDDALGY